MRRGALPSGRSRGEISHLVLILGAARPMAPAAAGGQSQKGGLHLCGVQECETCVHEPVVVNGYPLPSGLAR